jgi:hypothetical protein
MQLNPSAGLGVRNKFDAVVDPTVNDDDTLGFSVGSMFINVTTGHAFILVDATTSAAHWDRFSPPFQFDLFGVNGGLIYDNAGNTVELSP